LIAAYALALRQEEVAESIKPTSFRDVYYATRGRALPLPAPPCQQSITIPSTIVDMQGQEGAWASHEQATKLSAFKSYRCA
jgi:hypothetical protein